jgi:hypothetical protein
VRYTITNKVLSQDNEEAEDTPDIMEIHRNLKGKLRAWKSAPSRKRKRSDSESFKLAEFGVGN